jgi:hypothetical protein
MDEPDGDADSLAISPVPTPDGQRLPPDAGPVPVERRA